MDPSTTTLRPPPPPPPPPPIFAFTPIPPPPPADPSLPPSPLPFASPQQIFPVGTLDNYIPPPFPDSPSSVDLSPLEFILALMAVITIPALIYAFVFAIRCPTSWPSRDSPRRRPSGDDGDRSSAEGEADQPVASGLKYRKEAHVKEMGSECPVCLSAFAEGEDIRQLSLCKHSFHATCIDMWLGNHSNCPICRADVPVKRPNNPARVPGRGRDQDLQQGLPDASNLV